MSLSLILGMFIVGALLTYFSFQLDEEHFILKLLIIIFVFILSLIIIPKSGLDQVCEPVMNYTDEIYVYGDNYSGYHWDYDSTPPTCNPNDLDCVKLFHVRTTYDYDTHCYTPPAGTGLTFFKWSTWLFRLFIAYLIFYFGYVGLNQYKDWRKKKQGHT